MLYFVTVLSFGLKIKSQIHDTVDEYEVQKLRAPRLILQTKEKKICRRI